MAMEEQQHRMTLEYPDLEDVNPVNESWKQGP